MNVYLHSPTGRVLAFPKAQGRPLRRCAIAGLMLAVSLQLAPAEAQSPPSAPPQSQVARNAPLACRLAADGQVLQKVIVGAQAAERTRAAAATLADYLGRISDAPFTVETGNGEQGIAVGTPADFAHLELLSPDHASNPRRREDYVLRSHANGLFLVGATEQAVEHAVWDLLYRLGHRQFFPGDHWEIIPRRAELSLAVDRLEQPDYHVRRIWYGYGPWDYAAEPYRQWCVKNRAVSGIALSTGHAYDGIISRNKDELANHPEYLGLVAGQRKSSKLCIGNPGLRQMVIDDALRQLEADPARDSLSLDPSDGLGWCECERCQALGSVTDRALTLANEVAQAVNAKHPGKLIGMYAYSAHSPPPSIRVHPQVVISVATAFIYGGYTAEELLAGWQRQGATLGIREYYSVHTWDRDLPGKARGGNLKYIASTIPRFHELGARYFSSESSDNWAPNGLGYYVASRLLWNTGEAQHVDALVDDFFAKAFGDARQPMQKFYQLLDSSQRPLLSDDLVGRMYRLLGEARQSTTDPAVQRRLNDLLLYARYVELWLDYSVASGEPRQQAFEALIRHTYRMRQTMMVHAKAVYRDVNARDKSVTIPPEALWSVPEANNPWKSSEPFSASELAAIEAQGIERRQVRGFEAVSFSRNLAPAAQALNLPDAPTGSAGIYLRGKRSYYTYLPAGQTELALTAKAGIIYTNRGPAQIALTPFDGERFPEDSTEENPIEALSTASVEPDKADHRVVLKARPGLHLLEATDRSAGTQLAWEEGLPMTVESSMERPAALYGRWNMVFYVPRGTRFIGGYSSGEGRLLNPQGNLAHTFTREPGYFQIPVPAGQDGKLWRFANSAGQRLLMTVPPYLARSPQELLLPVEVIDRDRQ